MGTSKTNTKEKFNKAIADVYIAVTPQGSPIGELDCNERMIELDSISNTNLKRDKYFVWKLLCYALEKSVGLRGKQLKFTKEDFGGWSVNGAEFSFSHCNGVLAVVVSSSPVGVDIEQVGQSRADKLAKRIMTDREISAFEKIPLDQKEEAFIKIWTAKEAIFKSQKSDRFIPRDIDTLSHTIKTDIIMINGKKYIWSVATSTPCDVKIFTDVELT